MKINDITRFLETLAPPVYQENYDNCGLLLGSQDEDCRGALVSLDVTESVIGEAVKKNCNLVIAHHPLIFRGLKKINKLTETGRAVIAAVKNNVAVYAIHTNLDNVLPGVNSVIADKLGLTGREILLPKIQTGNGKPDRIGSGLIGSLPQPLSEEQMLARLKERFGVPVIRHSPLTGRQVKRVAVCGGSGSFLITNALAANADFFITSDIKYHEFFDAERQLVLADIGHYESEQFTIDFLHDIILKKFPNFAVLKAGTTTNPVHYYL